MADRAIRVVLVDDDPQQIEMMTRYLRLEGFDVTGTSEAIGASNVVRSFVPDVVLVDVQIPVLSGDRLLPLMRKVAAPDTKFVLFSACDEEKLRTLARETGADSWISKSWDRSRIARTIRKLAGKDTMPTSSSRGRI